MEFFADLTVSRGDGEDVRIEHDEAQNLVVTFPNRRSLREWLRGQPQGTLRSYRQLRTVNDLLNRMNARVRLRVGERELLQLGHRRPTPKHVDLATYAVERAFTRRPLVGGLLGLLTTTTLLWLLFKKDRE
ncbi:MAG: hypothetical protein WBA12_07135 [Catalinimonas sp.]